jgi:hypothetical protein
MTTYGLNINIDSAGLTNIYNAGQHVTLVKSVGSSTTQGSTVAWVTFQPYQSNVVSWVENYLIYGTVTSLQSGAQIVMTSSTQNPVQTGWTYTFEQGQFTGASGGASGSFNVENQQSNGINFGLAQSANVNGTNVLAPLNAVPVNMNQDASFTPIETVSIFLSSYANNGVVISSVTGNALAVQLTSASPTATIGFNDANNTFYLSGSNTALLRQEDLALGTSASLKQRQQR